MTLTIDLSAGGGLRGNCRDEELGTPDGRLLFKRKLGQGAEGSVYLAVPAERSGSSRSCCRRDTQQEQRHNGRASSSASASSSPATVGRLPVAVKVVIGDAFRRYKETRCLWPSLRHPNIVFPRKTTFDNSNQRCFLEMEFCEIDLLDLVKRDGPLSEARGALFAGHLAAGLAHCHSLGIAHQDIKLENVFLRHGVAKLGDFGSIRQVLPTFPQYQQQQQTPEPAPTQHRQRGTSRTATAGPTAVRGHSDSNKIVPSPEFEQSFTPHQDAGKAAARRTNKNVSIAAASPSPFVGSPQYAPPEAFENALGKGAGSFDHAAAAAVAEVTTAAQSWGYDSFASDVWSLGILLYAAVAGCLPWERACVRKSAEFRRYVERGAEEFFPESFSPGLASLLSRMLSIDQRKRPTAAEILHNDPWVTTPPTTPPSLSSSPSVRRPAAATQLTWPSTTTPVQAVGHRPIPVTPPEETTPTAGAGAAALPLSPTNTSPIPLPAKLSGVSSSTVQQKRAVCGPTAGAFAGTGRPSKRVRLPDDRGSAGAGSTTAVDSAAVGAAVPVAIHTAGKDSKAATDRVMNTAAIDDHSCARITPPLTSPCPRRQPPNGSCSPVLRLPELESNDILGGGGAASSGSGSGESVPPSFDLVAREREMEAQSGRGTDSIARLVPNPSPCSRSPPPAASSNFTLSPAIGAAGGSTTNAGSPGQNFILPRFIAGNQLRTTGMKRPAPTGRAECCRSDRGREDMRAERGGGEGWIAPGATTGTSRIGATKSAFKRCKMAGPTNGGF